MKSGLKTIVIDKDVFGGINTNDLCAFAGNHFLILPEVLLYECLTTEKNKGVLLDRFRQVMLAGAYICPPIKTIVHKEAQTLSPYGFLADLKMTINMRKEIKKNEISFNSSYIQKIYQKHCDSAQVLIDSTRKTTDRIISERPEVVKKAKKYQGSKPERLKLWVQTVVCQDVHKLAIEKLNHLTDSPDKYCLSDDWVTWHYFCLVSAIHLEYSFQQTVPGKTPELIKAEHDCQDIEYVIYLSRVDGLLTKDKQSVALAKAAFPKRDMFSSLDEVPDEYICRWS